MVKSPRPTIEQIKEALVWWNGLPQPGDPRPCPAQKQVRDELGIGDGKSLGADNIARYWMINIQPNQLKDQP